MKKILFVVLFYLLLVFGSNVKRDCIVDHVVYLDANEVATQNDSSSYKSLDSLTNTVDEAVSSVDDSNYIFNEVDYNDNDNISNVSENENLDNYDEDKENYIVDNFKIVDKDCVSNDKTKDDKQINQEDIIVNSKYNNSEIRNITEDSTKNVEVSYSTHIEAIGWQDYKSNGELSGTTGEGKRLEAIKIILDNAEYSDLIQYRTHIEGVGWQDYKSNGELSGTTGEAKRLEAIKIKLSGEVANNYDIYYRVHVQSLGWLGWAKNDEVAGSCGYGLRLEAIEVKLLKAGELFEVGSNSYFRKLIEYETHVQDIGWQERKADGELSGTTGDGKRIEAIKIFLNNSEYSGLIEYSTHVEGIGWQDYKSNGKLSGTTGEAKRIEAIKIKLSGEVANNYDIYYRVHVQSLGWLGWTKNDGIAGSSGLGLRLEAIQIKLLNAGESFEVGPNSYFHRLVEYQSHVEGIGWQEKKADGELSGTTGDGRRLEAYNLKLINPEYEGKIEYKTYIEDIGWETEYRTNGQISGTTGKSKRIEAIKIKLTGEMSEKYDVYYKVHVQGFGDLGWAKNDEMAGTIGYSYRIEAFETILVEKGKIIDDDCDAFIENNDGYFVIASYLDTTKVLDVYGELTKNGTDVLLYDRGDSLNQIWKISKQKNGTYLISSSLNPNVCLTSNNSNVYLFEKNGNENQLWQIEELDDGFVSIVSKKSGLYLDVIDSKIDNGTKIGTCESSGAGNQKYMLITFDKRKVYKGMDVSSHQNIDWNVAQQSVNFAIVRLGFGSDYSEQDDAKFIENIRGCEENNIPYGIYIYSYALNVGDAVSEANHALRLVKETGSNFQLGIWFDMEDADGYKLRHGFFDGNQAAKEVDICDTFLRIISSNGYNAGLYASLSWLNGDLNNPRLNAYDKWVAHWNGPVTYNQAILSHTTYSMPYRYWQFCSDGHINGVSGGIWNNVDLDLGYDIFD